MHAWPFVDVQGRHPVLQRRVPAAPDRGRRGEGEEVPAAARCGDEAGAGEKQPAEDSPLGAVIGRGSVVVENTTTTTTTTTCVLQS